MLQLCRKVCRKVVFWLRPAAGLQRFLKAAHWEVLMRLWLSLSDQEGTIGQRSQPAEPVRWKQRGTPSCWQGHGAAR